MRRSFVAFACLGFPEDRIQRDMVGSAGEHALREAFLFWQEAKAYFNGLSARPLNECYVLDFGCGWGRYTRLFLKDTPRTALWVLMSIRSS